MNFRHDIPLPQQEKTLIAFLELSGWMRHREKAEDVTRKD